MKHLITCVILLLAVTALLGVSVSHAANILIVESQSYSTAQNQDTQWQIAATNMGHSATIVPQTTLDNTGFIATTDLLIVSSGVITLPANRVASIQAMMEAGKPVYLQCEYPMTVTTTQAFEDIVNNLGYPFTSFSWLG